MTGALDGRGVAILAADGVERVELEQPIGQEFAEAPQVATAGGRS